MKILADDFNRHLAFLATPGFAVADGSADATQNVSTYKETAVFNHVVGDARFVGNFVAGPGRCDVTVFQTGADNAALTPPLRRFVLPIAAGARSELEVGPEIDAGDRLHVRR